MVSSEKWHALEIFPKVLAFDKSKKIEKRLNKLDYLLAFYFWYAVSLVVRRYRATF